jgi:solute carrier family 25 (mitochondrial carnitine/acylcarnitine transporter), member 20/29
MDKPAQPAAIPVWHRFIAGTASGVALVLVGHPLDTVKVKMQIATGAAPPSLATVVARIARQEGVRGFYRGFLPPLVFTGAVNTVLWGLQFSFTDAMERYGVGAGATSRAMTAAIASGLIVSVMVTPIEGIKTRMQAAAAAGGGASGSSFGASSTIAVLKSTLADGGFSRGLFRGWSATALARMSNYGYFGGNAFFTGLLSTPGEAGWQKTRTSLLAGGMAGLCYWLCAFPWDTLKARMMLAPTPYPSLRSAAAALYADAGARGFWRGFTPCALRAFPANAAAFAGFSLAMDALHQLN